MKIETYLKTKVKSRSAMACAKLTSKPQFANTMYVIANSRINRIYTVYDDTRCRRTALVFERREDAQRFHGVMKEFNCAGDSMKKSNGGIWDWFSFIRPDQEPTDQFWVLSMRWDYLQRACSTNALDLSVVREDGQYEHIETAGRATLEDYVFRLENTYAYLSDD